ncbi:uncharacterized protein EI97DRAFT_429969 [Westerdykella ornata]|uniref:DUF7137 domain-containing protein n=1 Tax=Westerdykella ornata TaxID=318751 RepID=A0A6A6JUB9_WESOR|nr:uncharacterized protein EI97DRAFT_429969 [Westerdykella ornata]KAF2280211.1 hypothetical protein EI97DRAFT_429969 [Westerdykella ornata]
MRPSQLFAAAVALSSVSAALSDVFPGERNAVGQVKNVLYGRQDNPDSQSETSQPSQTRPTGTQTQDDKPSNTGDAEASDKPEGSSKPEQTDKPTGTTDPSASKATTKKPKSTEFDPRLPAGGISMITPAALAGPQYYKVGEWVTFAWNYTSLSVTPSAIDVLASCSANQATYTLAVNQSVQETGVVLWDTGAYQSTAKVPLLTEMYTLVIYDSNGSPTDTPKAGYLGAYKQFIFGMYTPHAYVPLKDFTCPNCNPNAAFSSMEALTLKMLGFTCMTTMASLVYFAYSFGVF